MGFLPTVWWWIKRMQEGVLRTWCLSLHKRHNVSHIGCRLHAGLGFTEPQVTPAILGAHTYEEVSQHTYQGTAAIHQPHIYTTKFSKGARKIMATQGPSNCDFRVTKPNSWILVFSWHIPNIVPSRIWRLLSFKQILTPSGEGWAPHRTNTN